MVSASLIGIHNLNRNHSAATQKKMKAKNTQTKKDARIPRRKVANFSTIEGQQQVVKINNMHKTLKKLIISLKKQNKERKTNEIKVEAAIDNVTANTDQLQS